MKKITSLWLLPILLFLSACSSHQPLNQTSFKEEEASMGENTYNHRLSIRMEEESEERFEKHKE